MKFNRRYLYMILITLGLVLRTWGLFFEGTHDMQDAFYPWGLAVLQHSLAQAFGGIYFPLTYLFFGISAWLAGIIPNLWFLPFKATNLFFEILIFLVLWKIFPRHRGKVLVFYWLNPWLILLESWQGFWDGLMVFSVILSVLVFDSTQKGLLHKFFVSGLLMGIALMVKPQAQAVIAAIGLWLFVTEILHGKFNKTVNYFIGLSLPFFAFSFYFFLAGQSIFFLLKNFLTTGNFPVLVASEINVWYPISRLIQVITSQTGRIYEVSLSPILFRVLALGSIGLFALIILLFVLRKRTTMFDVATLASWLLPQIVVMSHANHFVMAAILMVYYVINYPRLFLWPWLISILIHLINSFLHYGFGSSSFFNPVIVDESLLQSILGIIAFITTLQVIKGFLILRADRKK